MSFPDKPVAHLLGSNGPVHAVAYSANPGTYILTGSSDRSIRLYNPCPGNSVSDTRSPGSGSIPQGRLIQTYSAHGYEVLSLAIGPGNERFVSSGGDRSVFLWDVAAAVTIRRFGGNVHGHTARVNCVTIAGEGGSLVISGGFDTTVRIWDAKSGSFKPVQVLQDARDSITSVVATDSEIVTGSVDGRVRSYDLRMGRCITDVIGASVTSLSLTKDGRAMLVGSLDSKIRLMDRDTGGCLRAYSDPSWHNKDIRMQSLLGGSERYVVAGDEMVGEIDSAGDGMIWAWDLLSGAVVNKIKVPWGPRGYETKKMIGKDGKEKARSNIISCIDWRAGGWGDQYCVGGTSGVVTVFGSSY